MRPDESVIHVHAGRQLPDRVTSPDTYLLPGYGVAANAAADGEWFLLEAFDEAHTEIRAEAIDVTDELSFADYFPAYSGGTTDV